MAISVLKKRIETIENILKALKQRYTMQCHLSEEMRRKVESVAGKMTLLDQVVDMARHYSEEFSKVSEQNIMLESQSRLLDL
jgi:ferritin-like metal-binding protein YciE